jgi:hypothetical protein
MAQLRPYLQVNAETFSLDVYRAAYELIKPLAAVTTGVNIAPKELMAINNELKNNMGLFDELMQILVDADMPEAAPGFIEPIVNIASVVLHSGLIDDDIEQWLNRLTDQDMVDMRVELEDIQAMQDELLWLMRRVGRMLSSRLLVDDAVVASAHYQKVQNVTDRMLAALENSWRQYQQ